MNSIAKEYLTVSEIAKQSGVSRQAIDKRITEYRVPYTMFGKTRVIKKSDLYLLKIK